MTKTVRFNVVSEIVRKSFVATILLSSMVCLFFLGVMVGHYEWRPYAELRKYFRWVTVVPFKDRYTTIDPKVANIDPDQFIHIGSVAEIEALRTKLIRTLWSGRGFPLQRLPSATTVLPSELPMKVQSRATIERLDMEMEYGFNSIAFFLRPKHPVGRLMIFQQGHAAERSHDEKVIDYFLSRGYDVVFLDMLLQNSNHRPTIDTPPFGKLTYRKHDQLKFLESDSFNPIKLFLEPIAVAINYVLLRTGSRNVAMVGLSGGGALTALYSALDVRVMHSFPVAGTAPMYMRFGLPESRWGDYEQTQPKLYALASELDLYIMAAAGDGRQQVQIFNLYDPCCYGGQASMLYEQQVKKTIHKIGSGNFSVWIDTSIVEHAISDAALRRIEEAIDARGT